MRLSNFSRLVLLTLAVVIGELVTPVGRAQQSDPGGNVNAVVQSLHVQGSVWMISAGSVNAAVQIGEEGVLVVDTLTEALADKFLAEIGRLAGGKPIRTIVNTHFDPDHTGGNAHIGKAGRSIVGGNFAPQVGPEAANAAQIFAHENVQLRMIRPSGDRPPPPFAAMPTDTFIESQKDLYFNGEAVQLIHEPGAHSDGDTFVYFRKSDVIVSGDLYVTTTFPVVELEQGGDIRGVVKAANDLIKITVPKEKQEGGTYVIPGHGRLADEADVVEYRDMLTIIRDRFQDSIDRGMSLEQVKAARLVRDYEGRYGASSGPWTTDAFVEAVYRSLMKAPAQ